MTRRKDNQKNAKGQGRKVGKLSARYATVAPNVRRIIWRPSWKPPRLYMVITGCVMICNPATFDKKKLLARGYVRTEASKNGTQVYEKTISR